MIKGQNLEMNWGVRLSDSTDVPDGVSTLWEKNLLICLHAKARFF